ncbi:hypothetical protein AYL99_09155 [Fonsecaea erecta]|uniref:CREG-like beta-barrel domain-containing protein n=1 Tax=Fonsecaea erecta TaxID=1367422 RepID=A0A178ZBJ8_9EURO|nr:hypothetical protein AYL99_09155 [Fonsecaea erecta]OAP57042.1 hypothetical protein AYL99_09155 [Fonsecaea erecta]
MRIHSPWTLAAVAVQILGLLGPRAALCAPPAVGVAVMERQHGRHHEQQQDGQMNMVVGPSPLAPEEPPRERWEHEQQEQLLGESPSAAGAGIESLFSDTPYRIIPFPPLFAESIVAQQARTASSFNDEDDDRHSEEDGGTKDGQDSDSDNPTVSRPTRYYSTVLGRRLLALSSHGVLTTVFPANLSSSDPSTHGVPASVADTPIGLPEYIASCEEPSGNPTILSLKVSTSTRNAVAGSNVSLTLSWWDEYIHLTGKQPWALANLPRLSLTGYLEEISADEVSQNSIETCFLQKHRDSVMWLPGRKWAAHQGYWTRLVVTQAYWIGGFGDKNYIGWFDPDEWRTVRKEDWEGVRLPGEKE